MANGLMEIFCKDTFKDTLVVYTVAKEPHILQCFGVFHWRRIRRLIKTHRIRVVFRDKVMCNIRLLKMGNHLTITRECPFFLTRVRLSW